mmetsp:Transcript_7597/g.19497  ORF Transcript_7597/g.19497 Transcript_7597/m.19497 type:complete len:220 (+) Transcript_7597:186-845(+)
MRSGVLEREAPPSTGAPGAAALPEGVARVVTLPAAQPRGGAATWLDGCEATETGTVMLPACATTAVVVGAGETIAAAVGMDGTLTELCRDGAGCTRTFGLDAELLAPREMGLWLRVATWRPPGQGGEVIPELQGPVGTVASACCAGGGLGPTERMICSWGTFRSASVVRTEDSFRLGGGVSERTAGTCNEGTGEDLRSACVRACSHSPRVMRPSLFVSI